MSSQGSIAVRGHSVFLSALLAAATSVALLVPMVAAPIGQAVAETTESGQVTEPLDDPQVEPFTGAAFSVAAATGGEGIHPGGTVSIAADGGFPANEDLRIDLGSTTPLASSSADASPVENTNDSSGTVANWASARTDADGAFSVEAVIPADESIGDHDVTVYDADGTGQGRLTINVVDPNGVTIKLTFDKDDELNISDPLHGRVFLLLTQCTNVCNNQDPIELFGNDESFEGAVSAFGQSVSGVTSGSIVTMRETGDATTGAYGYLLDDGQKDWDGQALQGKHSLNDIPMGTYKAQALFEPYTENERSDGSTADVYQPSGEGGWHDAPGNFRSEAFSVTLTRDHAETISADLSTRIAAPEGADQTEATGDATAENVVLGTTSQQGFQGMSPTKDEGYGIFKEFATENLSDGRKITGAVNEHGAVRYIKIKSEKLTKFWGKPVYLGADVVLPYGYDDPENVNTHYPTIYQLGHFSGNIAPQWVGVYGGDWDGDGKVDDSLAWQTQHTVVNTSTNGGAGAYSTYMNGYGLDAVLVNNRDENAFFDDSYLVNSVNVGPWGDAWNDEMVPFLDHYLRTIDEPYARAVTGGSTGGWIAAAMQIFRPDIYGSSWVEYPDVMDFSAYQNVDLYDDRNAYIDSDGSRGATARERGEAPSYADDVRETTEDAVTAEVAYGTRSRSLGQFGIWSAVFGAQGSDGLPLDAWDPLTGEKNEQAAATYSAADFSRVLEEGWDSRDLKDVLRGKLHVWVGTQDTYYLEKGVMAFQNTVDELLAGEGDGETTSTVRTQANPDDTVKPIAQERKITTFTDGWADFTYGEHSIHGYNPYSYSTASGGYVPPAVYQFLDMLNWIRINAPAGADLGAIEDSQSVPNAAQLLHAELAGPVDGVEWNQDTLDSSRGNLWDDVEAKGVPVEQVGPTITGSSQVGSTLTASAGTWDADIPDIAYQWTRDGAPIADATGDTYTLTDADDGAQVAVTVQARSTTRSPAWRTSAGIAASNASQTPGGNGTPGSSTTSGDEEDLADTGTNLVQPLLLSVISATLAGATFFLKRRVGERRD